MHILKKFLIFSVFLLSAHTAFSMSALRSTMSALAKRTAFFTMRTSKPSFFAMRTSQLHSFSQEKKLINPHFTQVSATCLRNETKSRSQQKSYWEICRDFVKSRYKKYMTRLFGGTAASVALMQEDESNKRDTAADIKAFIAAMSHKNFVEAEKIAPYVPKNLLHEMLFITVNQEEVDLQNMVFLLTHGARIVNLPSGTTALHAAALKGHVEVVHMICEKYEISPNLRDKKTGDTLAHSAAKNGQKEMVEELEKMGADLTLKNGEGKTPLDYLNE